MKKQFTKELLVDGLDLPWNDSIVKYNEVIDTSRWSIIYDLVFEFDGKCYQTTYSVGATESQDERPWEYEDIIDCVEVEEKEVMVKQWVEV